MNVQVSANPAGAKPYWADSAPKADLHAPLAGDTHTDVTVIGAGFTGLRAALHLAEAGTNVTVLDASDVAFGASGRNGGQVNPMLPFNTPKQLLSLLGSTHFERLTETSLNSADELFELIKTYQIDCQARQKGWLRVMHNEKALRNAEAGVDQWNKHGAGMEIIDRDAVEKLSGTKAYRAGVVTPKGGAVQPLSLALGMAQAAKQRGVIIHGNSAVTDLTRKDSKWTATTANGGVTSDWAIVATNGYTDSLIPKLSKTILPVHPIQMASEPLSEEVIGAVLPNGHTISDSRRVIMYARREPDNRMIYGGHGTEDTGRGIGGFDWLRKDVARVFPQLSNVKWDYHWGGRIAITQDHLPHMHEPREGLLLGLGYNGRGVAMSNVMGRVLAQRVLGADKDALAFPSSPVKTIPYRMFQVGGMGTAVWFMKLLDYLETR